MRLVSFSKIFGVLAVALGLAAPFAAAEVPLDGSFVAGQNCSAFQSIKKQSNPVPLTAGTSYQIVAGNKEPASHFLILVPGASPERRWAPVDCGTRSGGAPMGEGSTSAQKPGKQAPSGGQPTQNVLAVSWQPAFCETKPDKVECRTQTADRFDASNFTLHGLWPQPRRMAYCNVGKSDIGNDKDGRWDQLPEVSLEPPTRAELDKVMPGTQSQLERHEWTKHGTCYSQTPEEYFSEALALIRALNGSAVRELFASRVGQQLTFDEIRKAFDQSFGEGAGLRVRMQCARNNGKLIISELTIGLSGDITPETSLANLMAAATPTKTECPGGLVDAVGQQ